MPSGVGEQIALNTGKIDTGSNLPTSKFDPKRRKTINGRPEIREILIIKKLRYWQSISRYRCIEPSYPRARARRNYWRLLRKYPEIAGKIGLKAASVY